MTTVDRCGTYAGWNRHQRLNEPICADCREASTRYHRDLRNRKSIGRSVTWPREVARVDILDLPALGAVIARSFREAS